MEPPKNKLEIRKNRVVCVPFNSDEYRTVVESASAFRAYMDEKIRLFPELFPENINPGYKLKDVYHSIKLCIPIRRILVLRDWLYSSSVLCNAYMTGMVSDVEDALFLRNSMSLSGLWRVFSVESQCIGIESSNPLGEIASLVQL